MENKFKIEDENNNIKIAEVLTTFKYKEKEYIIYSIDEDDTSNVYVSILTKDTDGYDKIKNIEDEEEKEEIDKVVKKILSLAS